MAYDPRYQQGQRRQPPEYGAGQRPATPPQWGQGAPPRRDGSGGYPQQPRLGPQPYQQPQYQQPARQPAPPGYRPPPDPRGAPAAAPPKPNAAKGCAMLGCGGAAAVFILVAVLVSHGSTGSGSPSGAQTQAAAPAQVQTEAAAAGPQTVTYVVSGSDADVTYGPAGSSESGSVPMDKTADIPSSAPLYYSVQAQLQGAGTVSCQIKVDGRVISSSTASGGYNIAMCEIGQNPLTGTWQDDNS